MTADGMQQGHFARRYRRRPIFLAALLATACALALAAAPALAYEGHSFDFEFGAAGDGAGQLHENRGVAVNQADGSVYVADAGNFRVEKFDAAGNFVLAFGKGVNLTTSGDVCTAASGNTCGAGTQGSGGSGFDSNGGFGNPGFVAVDQTSGDVYVADLGTNTVDEFSPAGAFITSNNDGGAFGNIAGIAVDSSRDLWVYDESATMREFDSSGTPVTSWNAGYGVSAQGIAVDSATNLYVVRGTPVVQKFSATGSDLGEADKTAAATGLAIDPTSDDLYVIEGGGEVKRYSGGSLAESFGVSELAAANGIAVRGANGEAYVSDPASSSVTAFAQTTLAAVSASSPELVGAFTATVAGSVEPGGVAVSACEFEFGTNPGALAETADCEQTLPGDEGKHAVTASLTGLESGKTYFFRVKVTNANGVSRSSSLSFETTRIATTEAATGVTPRRATLHGTVLPEGQTISECFFEYGETESYGETVPCKESVPADEEAHQVSAEITGLTPNGAVYHYRLVVVSPAGTARGGDLALGTEGTTVTERATGIAPPVAILNGSVNPAGVEVTECLFEFGETEAYGQTIPCEESSAMIGAGEKAVSVHAQITGLAKNSVYHYRFVSASEFGNFSGRDQVLRTFPPDLLFSRTASVGTNQATLSARVAPNGIATRYLFEWGTDTSYGNFTQEAILGEDEFSSLSVSEILSGLAPGTTYHWRLIVNNPVETITGPDHSFTTFSAAAAPETNCPNQVFRENSASAGLPDCRAFEQASPTDKNGADVEHLEGLVQASADGNRVTFGDVPGLPTTGGSGPDYVASRGTESWSTNGLAPPLESTDEGVTLGWDGNLQHSLTSSYTGLYLHDIPAASWEHVFPTERGIFPTLDGFANDTQHLILEEERLQFLPTEAIGGERPNLYDLDHGTMTLVGRIPSGGAKHCDDSSAPACELAPNGAFSGSYQWQVNEASGGSTEIGRSNDSISDDGSKVIFTAAGSGQIYVREDGTATTWISASKRATPDPNGPLPAALAGNTSDDSKVFFLSCEKLTEDSTAVRTAANSCTQRAESEPFANLQGQDLYVYDTGSEELTDLSVDENSSDPLGAGVISYLGASGDGEVVYFVANGVLADGASQGNCRGYGDASVGTCNIYVSDHGEVEFVAPISEPGGFSTYKALEARVSASGALLFASLDQLGGYENGCESPENGSRCAELYRFAPGAPAPTCVSCDPTGAAPLGSAVLVSQSEAFAADTNEAFETRNISSDGKRIFFDSPDPLVVEDTDRVVDPYEWEANGTGSCRSAAVGGGCLYLLTTGRSPHPSFLGDVSETGNDAFIFTDDRLVPADKDSLVDAYDVRVGGGLASQNQVQTSPPCSNDACRGAGTTQPAESSPGSSTFSGPPNPTQKKKHGKKKHPKKKHHHKKKQKKHHGQRPQRRQPRANVDRGGSK